MAIRGIHLLLSQKLNITLQSALGICICGFDLLHVVLQYIFIEKNLHMSEPMQFKPMLFKGIYIVYFFFLMLFPWDIFPKVELLSQSQGLLL